MQQVTVGRVNFQNLETCVQSALRPFRDFLAFAQYPFWSVTPASEPEGGLVVELYDLRFGRPPHKGFKASAILDSQTRVVRTWLELL